MRVAIIGAGGVGGFIGALLANAGHDVRFLARGQHLQAVKKSGLQLRSKQFGDLKADGLASDDPAEVGPAELVLIAVKMYDFALAAEVPSPVM